MKKRIGFTVFLVMMFSLIPLPAIADNGPEKERVHQLDEVTVRAKTGGEAFTYKPESTTIDLDSYESIDTPQNVGDILKRLDYFRLSGGKRTRSV
jgi:hypothetical protein